MAIEEPEGHDFLEIKTYWGWNEIAFAVVVVRITGGGIPQDLRDQLASEISDTTRAPRDSAPWKKAKSLIHQLSADLPQPAPIPMGDVHGEITSVPQASCELNRDIHMQYVVTYANRRESRETKIFRANEITEIQLAQAEELHREANGMAWARFNEIFGGGEIDLSKWKQEKTKVFVSYRDSGEQQADQLVERLGEYENRTVFKPVIDRLGMQAGNWMPQLMDWISGCEVFLPVLTQDYLDGPIAKPELDQALREYYADKDKKIIPVLVEGTVKDYQHHFLGGIHIVEALDGITAEIIDNVAHLALGVNRNPY